MDKLVKNVFLMLLGSTVAMILYFVFFGVDLAPYGQWEGLLMFSSRAIETPIAKYYYDYCYLPNIHYSDSVDRALGGVSSVTVSLQNTPSNLTSSSSDYMDFSTVTNHYSTGWR